MGLGARALVIALLVMLARVAGVSLSLRRKAQTAPSVDVAPLAAAVVAIVTSPKG